MERESVFPRLSSADSDARATVANLETGSVSCYALSILISFSFIKHWGATGALVHSNRKTNHAP